MCNLNCILCFVVMIIFVFFVAVSYYQYMGFMDQPSKIHVYAVTENNNHGTFESIERSHPLYKGILKLISFSIKTYYRFYLLHPMTTFHISLQIVFTLDQIDYIIITYNNKESKVMKHTLLSEVILIIIYSIYAYYGSNSDHITIYADYNNNEES